MQILAKQSLVGEISTKQKLIGTVAISNTVIIDHDDFEGPYEVIPMIDSQTLNTKEKLMKEDLVVLSIPYAEVTNSANGITVTIGE